MRKRPRISKAKAREMLRNPPHGRPLTKPQRGLFGVIASGLPLRGLRITRHKR
jgi:hypothetical protein